MDSEPSLRSLAQYVVGPAEIAELLGVHPNTVNTWKARGIELPAPIRHLRGIDLWDEREVLAWAERTGRYPPRSAADAKGADEALPQEES